MKDRIKLPLCFDVKRMQQDLDVLQQQLWIDHFVQQNYEGGWEVLPLRGQLGAEHPVMMIYSNPGCNEWQDTPFLEQASYIKDVLQQLKMPLQAVRLMRLTAGSHIKSHQDHDLDVQQGVVRLHIPIITNDKVYFILNDKRVVMEEGECWYLRLSDFHMVDNKSDIDRVHLVIDATVNSWFLEAVGRGV